jgi:epoxyqueuosine reductase
MTSPSSQAVLELTRAAGFDLAGVTPLRPPRGAARFQEWLLAGHHADMAWLAEMAPRILDPRLSLPEGRSLLVVGLGHARAPVSLADGARVARYAAGRDYHNVMGRKLRRLAADLSARGWLGEWKKVVDAGPLLERSHAAEAGLGFESKAANLLHPRHGPWFFLGELLIDFELQPTPTPPAGSCGTCTACLDACPTAAIVAPGTVDARRCLSYHTIENAGSIPHELRAKLGDWVFGCDVCSEVCPWGREAPDASARYGTHPAVDEGNLARWLDLDEAHFRATFAGSPLQRPGRGGLLRNAALVLGNRPGEEGCTALIAALGDVDPRVRAASFWALAHGHPEDARAGAALSRAVLAETAPEARADMQATLELEAT